MKSIIFDTGPIISLSLNSLLWVLEPLKKQFGGKFYITSSVKKELVDKPFLIKRFKFEAMQIMHYIDNGILEVIEETPELKKMTEELLYFANNTFFAYGKPIDILHDAEVETFCACELLKGDAVVFDERTMRLIIEKPEQLRTILSNKLHTPLAINKENLTKIKEKIDDVKVIRSSELAVVAYKLGLLKQYIPNIKQANENILDGILWGLKLNGCSIADSEIDYISRKEA